MFDRKALCCLTLSIFSVLCTANAAFTQSNGAETLPDPAATNKSFNLKLDKKLVYSICPNPEKIRIASVCSKENAQIAVTIEPLSNFPKDAEIYFSVSGGSINSDGMNAVWDLSTVPVGEYSISAAVGKDRTVSGNTVNANVVKENCFSCDPVCSCPAALKILGPEGSVSRGSIIVISANLGNETDKTRFQWTVENGTTTAGQGTNQIFLKTSDDRSAASVIVKLVVTSDESCICGTVSVESEFTLSSSK